MMRDAGDALRAMRCVRCAAYAWRRPGNFCLDNIINKGRGTWARTQLHTSNKHNNNNQPNKLNTTRMSAMDVICVMDDGHYICTPFYVGFSSSFLQVPCEEKVSDELPLLLTPPHHFIISHIIYVTWVRASQLDMIMKV